MNNLDWVLVATFFAILTVILVVWSAFVDGREDDRAHGRLEEQQVASADVTRPRDAPGSASGAPARPASAPETHL